jgi:deoxyribonuclease-4
MRDTFLHGCHLSIAGGVQRALDEAERLEINAIQVFTHAPSAWRMPTIPEEEAAAFRERRTCSAIRYLIVHTAYLLNLATPDPALHERSTAALNEEIARAHALEADAVVTHLGAHRGDGVDAGIERIVAALRRVIESVPFTSGSMELLLENTAGAGTTMGRTFEEMASILDRLPQGKRIGICLDSCHAFAVGYDLRTREALEESLSAFDAILGLDRLRVIHLNDAQHGLGSHRDRHEHIGHGQIGEAGFAALLNHPRLLALPFLLETPKELDDGTEADPVNLATLRRLRRPEARL